MANHGVARSDTSTVDFTARNLVEPQPRRPHGDLTHRASTTDSPVPPRLSSNARLQEVAVIIAAYNAAGTIARAVQSALAEPEVAEVVVVDDASTDSTVDAAQAADDGSGRLKVVVQPANRGQSAARNRGIDESRAEWIAVLDADDFFLPGRTASLLAYADQGDLIADDICQLDEGSLDQPRRSLIGDTLTHPRRVEFDEFVLSNAPSRGRKELGYIQPLMRRGFLEQHKIRYQEHMRLGEDYEIYTRALGCGARLTLVPGQGYVAVVRGDSLSEHHAAADLQHLRDCDRDLARIPGLTARNQAALQQHALGVECRLQWRIMINAMKSRQFGTALATFTQPWPVPWYLARRLCERAIRRFARNR